MRKTSLLVCLFVVFSTLNISGSNAILIKNETSNGIIYVDDDGGADFTNIQDAIDNASAGDTIFVYNGTYFESIVIDKEITLEGEDKNNTILVADYQYGNIEIISDNVIISKLTLKDGLFGISINQSSKNNNILENNFLNIEYCGICLYLTQDNLIENNYFFYCSEAILIYDSSFSIISQNTIENCIRGIWLYCGEMGEIILKGSANIIISQNTIINSTENIILENSSEITIIENTIDNNYETIADFGICLRGASNNEIIRNCISNLYSAVVIEDFDDNDDSKDNFVSENILDDNIFGISLSYTTNNTLSNNDISNFFVDDPIYTQLFDYQWGISLLGSSNNTVIGNKIEDGELGIYINEYESEYISEHNIIVQNNITNTQVGLKINNSLNNSLYYNNLINNIENAQVQSLNIFNTSNMGNYWHDYTGEDANDDGIGDTPYDISGGDNKDYYPLMEPYQFPSEPGPIKNLNTSETFNSIQDAIDDSDTVSGHTIFVSRGTYYENIVVDKSITLLGEDKDITIIDGKQLNGSGIFIHTNWVKIIGFSIKNFNFGIRLNNSLSNINDSLSNITISNNNILNNNDGIFGWNQYYNTIIYNNILNNKDTAIMLSGKYNNVSRNKISNSNTGIRNRCILTEHKLYLSSDNIISYNTLLNNDEGIYFSSDFNFENYTIKNNIIKESVMGIKLVNCEDSSICYNDFKENDVNAFVSNNEPSSWALALEKTRSNNWNHNYWNRPKLGPKFIFGFDSHIPTQEYDPPFYFHFLFTFDLRPALNPNCDFGGEL